MNYVIVQLVADKRDAERLSILGELQGDMMVFQPMLIREIGSGGITVETRYPLHLDSLHDLRLSLGNRSVIVKGRVVHSHISEVEQDVLTYRTGLQFIEPSDRVLSAINEFLEVVKTTRGGVVASE